MRMQQEHRLHIKSMQKKDEKNKLITKQRPNVK